MSERDALPVMTTTAPSALYPFNYRFPERDTFDRRANAPRVMVGRTIGAGDLHLVRAPAAGRVRPDAAQRRHRADQLEPDLAMPIRSEHTNYTDRVRAFLVARPGEWVLSDLLALVGGKNAWRTRVSECRVALEATGLGTVTNKLTRTRNDDGEVIAVRSWYRFVPAGSLPSHVPGVDVVSAQGSRQTAPSQSGRLF